MLSDRGMGRTCRVPARQRRRQRWRRRPWRARYGPYNLRLGLSGRSRALPSVSIRPVMLRDKGALHIEINEIEPHQKEKNTYSEEICV